jgi:hypothetical protein
MTVHEFKPTQKPEHKDADFEALLKAALTVPLPAQLGAHLQKPRVRPIFFRISRWAWAAMILLSIGGGILLERPWQASLEAQALAHIYEELAYLSQDQRVPPAQVGAVFQGAGLRVRNTFPAVRFIGPCVIAGQAAVHMILPGQMGPVTVIYVPGKQEDDFRAQDKRFILEGTRALDGMLVVAGERGEDLKALAQEVLERVG